MTVFLENRRRDSDRSQPGERPASRAPSLLASFLSSPRKSPPPASRESLWGLSYDRVEGVVHLVLAFAIVGGATAILSTALFTSGAPQGEMAQSSAKAEAAKVAVAVAPTKNEEPPLSKEMAPVAAPAPSAAASTPAASAPPAPAPLAPFFDARPMTETAVVPEPLAPPPPAMREKLAASQEKTAPSEPEAADQTTAPEPQARQEAASPKKSAEAPKAVDEARTAKCYLKLAGRVQNSGACKVHHTAEAVIFDLPGKPLEIAHKHGRVWIATLGGRNLGQVYKNKGAPCWGAKGFYACENS